MGVFDVSIVVPGGERGGVFHPGGWDLGTKIAYHVEGMSDALSDIFFEDLPGIKRGYDRFMAGIEDIGTGWATASGGFGGGIMSGLSGLIVGVFQVLWGFAQMVWGVAQMIYYGLMLVVDIMRLAYHAFMIGFSVFSEFVKRIAHEVIEMVKGEDSEGLMQLIDPMRWGRAFAPSGVPTVRENDYVRVGLQGKGIVREVTTIPGIGQLLTIKLNRGHQYIIVAAEEVNVLGHIYNSIRF